MDWATLRREFPVSERWAFLDHAGVSAIPRCVERSLVEYAADMAANGAARVGHWADRCEEVRRLIARFIGGDPRGLGPADS